MELPLSENCNDADRWRAIAFFWRSLLECPAHEFEELAQRFTTGLSTLLDADFTTIILAARSGSPESPLDGWRLRQMIAEEENESMAEEHIARERYFADPHSEYMVSGAGKLRAVTIHEAVSPEVWLKCPGYALVNAAGMADMLVGAVPIDARHELYVSILRKDSRPRFSRADGDRLVQILDGLDVAAKRIARSFGLQAARPLSPRERQTLGMLLQGCSEGEIAYDFNLSQRTVHEYVVGVYKKLGVRSRGELLALWLSA